jgi:hypothetical protein
MDCLLPAWVIDVRPQDLLLHMYADGRCEYASLAWTHLLNMPLLPFLFFRPPAVALTTSAVPWVM